MQGSRWWEIGFAAASAVVHAVAQKPAAKPVVVKPAEHAMCSSVVLEGDVKRGQSFEQPFAKGLVFKMEAIASGWIVRVLPQGPLPAHDFAELATLPYQSVTPLAVSTDFSFRAQDAAAWNPRVFRYAANPAAAARLEALYPRVTANDTQAASEAITLALAQPQAELRLENVVLAAGTANQWRMAAAVASHLENTPHAVAQGIAPTPLGELEELKFRVRLELPAGVAPAAGLTVQKNPCLF